MHIQVPRNSKYVHFFIPKLIAFIKTHLHLQSATFGAYYFLAFIIMNEKPSAKMKTGASQSYCYQYINTIFYLLYECRIFSYVFDFDVCIISDLVAFFYYFISNAVLVFQLLILTKKNCMKFKSNISPIRYSWFEKIEKNTFKFVEKSINLLCFLYEKLC